MPSFRHLSFFWPFGSSQFRFNRPSKLWFSLASCAILASSALLVSLMYSRLAKIKWQMCIYCLYPLLGCPIPHDVSYRMHFKSPFHISALLLSWSYGKVLPGSRSHIAHIRKDSHTCTICRIHFITKSSSCSRRFGIACFLSPICTCVPIRNLKGGGVALPRGPSIE